MVVDHNIQIWLETEASSIITPYVQSDIPRKLEYRVRASKRGQSGRSEVTQSGKVSIQSGEPVALGTIGMSLSPRDECHIELSLTDGGVLVATVVLDCPQ